MARKKSIEKIEQPQITSTNILVVRAELKRLIALVGKEVVKNEINNIIGKDDE